MNADFWYRVGLAAAKQEARLRAAGHDAGADVFLRTANRCLMKAIELDDDAERALDAFTLFTGSGIGGFGPPIAPTRSPSTPRYGDQTLH